MVVRVTKLFNFEMAHALLGYDGPCRNVHGHSYRLEITVAGIPNAEIGNPKLGMVIDFGQLKSIVNDAVLSYFDHATVLNERSDIDSFPDLNKFFGNLRLVPYQPTCENLLIDIRERVLSGLPDNISLVATRLYETATAFAEIIEKDFNNG